MSHGTTTPAISVHCPTCCAEPGAACTPKPGHPPGRTHQKRSDAAAKVTRKINREQRSSR